MTTIEHDESNIKRTEENISALRVQLQDARNLNNVLKKKQSDLELRVHQLQEEQRALVTDHQNERKRLMRLEKDHSAPISVEEKNDFENILSACSIDSSNDMYDLYMQEKMLRLDVCAQKASLIIAHDLERSQLIAHHEATMSAFYSKLDRYQ